MKTIIEPYDNEYYSNIILYLFILTATGLGQSNIVSVLFKILLILCACDKFWRIKSINQYNSTIFYKWGLLVISFFWLSLIWAINGGLGVPMCITVTVNIGCCLIAFYLINGSKTTLNNCIATYIIGSVLFVFYSYVTSGGVLGRHVGSSNGIALTMGHLSAISIVVCIYNIKQKINIKTNICLTLFFALIIIISGTRKAIILPFIAIGVYYFLTMKGVQKVRALILIGTGIFIIYYILMNIPEIYNIIGSRIETLIAGLSGSGKSETDASTLGRLGFITFGMEGIKERPLLGYGPNSFIYMFSRSHYDGYVAYSHNNFIEIAYSIGIIGLIIYYSIYFIILRKLYLFYLRNKDSISLLFFSLLVGILVIHYGWVAYFQMSNNLILVFAAAHAFGHVNREYYIVEDIAK